MEYTAQTVEEAIEVGLKELGVTKDQVEIKVIQDAKKGFLGIGKQDAIVELQVIKQASVQEEPVKTPSQEAPKEVVETPQVEEKRFESQEEFEQALIDLGHYLADITEKMGVETSIDVTSEKHTVYYDFDTKQEGLLIGKHGKTLNALQLLAQDYLDKRVRRRVRVILDVANYRERRAETLTHLAQKVGRDAIAQGKVQQLDPMPAYERKIIHFALADNTHVKTYSRGTEPHRYVVIEPVNGHYE